MALVDGTHRRAGRFRYAQQAEPCLDRESVDRLSAGTSGNRGVRDPARRALRAFRHARLESSDRAEDGVDVADR